MGYTIKNTPEDFRVEEIPADLKVVDSGKYTILKIVLRNWETNHFVTHLARYLGMSRKRITYAGSLEVHQSSARMISLKPALTSGLFQIEGAPGNP